MQWLCKMEGYSGSHWQNTTRVPKTSCITDQSLMNTSHSHPLYNHWSYSHTRVPGYPRFILAFVRINIRYLNPLHFIWNVYKYLTNKRNMSHFAEKCNGFHFYPNIKNLNCPELTCTGYLSSFKNQESTETSSNYKAIYECVLQFRNENL